MNIPLPNDINNNDSKKRPGTASLSPRMFQNTNDISPRPHTAKLDKSSVLSLKTVTFSDSGISKKSRGSSESKWFDLRHSYKLLAYDQAQIDWLYCSAEPGGNLSMSSDMISKDQFARSLLNLAMLWIDAISRTEALAFLKKLSAAAKLMLINSQNVTLNSFPGPVPIEPIEISPYIRESTMIFWGHFSINNRSLNLFDSDGSSIFGSKSLDGLDEDWQEEFWERQCERCYKFEVNAHQHRAKRLLASSIGSAKNFSFGRRTPISGLRHGKTTGQTTPGPAAYSVNSEWKQKDGGVVTLKRGFSFGVPPRTIEEESLLKEGRWMSDRAWRSAASKWQNLPTPISTPTNKPRSNSSKIPLLKDEMSKGRSSLNCTKLYERVATKPIHISKSLYDNKKINEKSILRYGNVNRPYDRRIYFVQKEREVRDYEYTPVVLPLEQIANKRDSILGDTMDFFSRQTTRSIHSRCHPTREKKEGFRNGMKHNNAEDGNSSIGITEWNDEDDDDDKSMISNTSSYLSYSSLNSNSTGHTTESRYSSRNAYSQYSRQTQSRNSKRSYATARSSSVSRSSTRSSRRSSSRGTPSASSRASSRRIAMEKGTRFLAFKYAENDYDDQVIHGYENITVDNVLNKLKHSYSRERQRGGGNGHNNAHGFFPDNEDPANWRLQRSANEIFSKAFDKNDKYNYNGDPHTKRFQSKMWMKSNRDKPKSYVSRLNGSVNYGGRGGWGSSKSYHSSKLELVMLNRDRRKRNEK
jgi:hypothetical protein